MKALILKFKPVIRFIITFLTVYTVFALVYKFYLQYAATSVYYPDYFTHMVAKQSEALLNVMAHPTQVVPHPDEPSLKLILKGQYLARVIEGCNGISVIILFLSFIIAFASSFKATLMYIFAGSVLIHSVNVLRIVLLSIGLYHYPEYEAILHTVIFPAVIYGIVFILWVVWVNQFSNLKQKHA